METIIAESAIFCKYEIASGAYRTNAALSDTLCMGPTNEKIGRVIDRLRLRAGLAKAELAERAGIDPGNLNRIISGKQGAPFDRLAMIAAALSVPVWQIIKEAEGPTGDQRKAILHDLIDALPADQIDQAFRRLPAHPAQSDKKAESA